MRNFVTAAAISVAGLGVGTDSRAQQPADSGFRAAAEGSWYHPVEIEKWAYYGADPAVARAVLDRIASAQGPRSRPDQPDTVTAHGPGQWLFEFTREGDGAMARAKTASDRDTRIRALREAIVYYHLASSPHRNFPDDIDALDRAERAYAAAASELPGEFRRVRIGDADQAFEVFLHLPPDEGPRPVVVMSNGSDMSKVTALRYYADHLLPRGIALLTLDLPGMGSSRAHDISDGDSAKLHRVAVAWARDQAGLDPRNIFVQGVSFGGNAAARMFLQTPETDLAGVVQICGLIDAFAAPPEVYAGFPSYTIDGVRARLGVRADAPIEQVAEVGKRLALSPAGLMAGSPRTTPLLIIGTNRDPAAPVDEMTRLAALSRDSEVVVFDLPGHCPPDAWRDAITASWIVRHRR